MNQKYLSTTEAENAVGVRRGTLCYLYHEHEKHRNDIDCYQDPKTKKIYFNLKSLVDYLSTPLGQRVKRVRPNEAFEVRPGRVYYLNANYSHLLAVAADDGSIYNLTTGNKLEPHINEDGYAKLTIPLKNGEYQEVSAHHIVAEAALPNVLHKHEVHHKKPGFENRSKNRPEDLAWVADEEHTQLHNIYNQGQLQKYDDLLKQIERDNSQPIYHIPCEYSPDNSAYEFYYEVTEAGYKEYQATGNIPTQIVGQFFKLKNNGRG